MSEQRPVEGEGVPRTHVLGYLTNSAMTATRVRMVTATAMRWIAIPFLIAAVLGLCAFISRALEIWTMFSHYGYWYSRYFLEDEVEREFGWHFLMLMGPSAVALLACADSVRKGRTAACRLGFVMLLPLVFAAMVAGAETGMWALYMGAGFYRSAANPIYLWWFVGTVTATFVALLLWDVGTYLRWIARNPLAEKPPVPFLPVRKA